jgi:hypothetical protein
LCLARGGRGSHWDGYRKLEAHARPAAEAVRLGPDAPAVRLDDLLGDGETEADASDLAVQQTVHAEEFIEDAVDEIWWDAYAAVLHADLDMAPQRPCAQRDRSALGAVLARIAQQVGQHLLDAVGFGLGER